MFVSRNIRPENFPTDVMPSPLCREPRQQARAVTDVVTLGNDSARRESGARGRRYRGPSCRRRGVEIRRIWRSARSLGRRRDDEFAAWGDPLIH